LAGYPGKQGRKPISTSFKVLAGNPGKRPLNENEPKPRTVLPRCPPHLSDEAKREWRRVSKMLYRLGLLTELDTTALALYCQTYSRWVEAEKKLASFGMLIETPNDLPMQSPYLSIANRCFDQLRAMLTEFGMTPSSRSRISAFPPQEEEDDPFEESLRRQEDRRQAG
jgi:P27 family predicted phage terminase small subunit